MARDAYKVRGGSAQLCGCRLRIRGASLDPRRTVDMLSRLTADVATQTDDQVVAGNRGRNPVPFELQESDYLA